MKNQLQPILEHYFQWLDVDIQSFELVFIDEPNKPPLTCSLPRVYINISIGHKYSFAFLRNVIVHEMYHVGVQGIYNALDMRDLRTQYSEIHGFTADVEADLVTFIYLHKFHNITLLDFYLAQYEGRGCFTVTRKHKWYYYPRFVGSILSIYYYAFSGIASVMTPSLETLNQDALMPIWRNESGRTIYSVVELPDVHYEQKITRLYHLDFETFDDYYSEMTDVAMEILARMKILDLQLIKN